MINIKGNAIDFYENFEGDCVLIHQANELGVMGSGIAKEIKARYPKVFEDYSSKVLALGRNIYTKTHDGKFIVSAIAQSQYGRGRRYTNYAALFKCFIFFLSWYGGIGSEMKIIIPKFIGCGLGGGDWRFVEQFLEDFEKMYGVTIYCCEL